MGGSNGHSSITSKAVRSIILPFSILGPMRRTANFCHNSKRSVVKTVIFFSTGLPFAGPSREDQSNMLSLVQIRISSTKRTKSMISFC